MGWGSMGRLNSGPHGHKEMILFPEHIWLNILLATRHINDLWVKKYSGVNSLSGNLTGLS